MLDSLPIMPLLFQVQDADDDQKKSNTAPVSIATHSRRIGIIYPPPDIRTIVDKTASFVVKNGPEFERKIIDCNAVNPKFSFLNVSHPYHAYYQQQLSQNRAPLQQSDAPAPDSALSAGPLQAVNDAISAKFRPVGEVLDPPEPEHYTIWLPQDGITGEEFDIIKLTAQYVAQNGEPFYKELTCKENKNSHFCFLRPTHSMFLFFRSLVNAYSKVLMPPIGLTEKLKKDAADITSVLDRCLHRLRWERSQEQARQKSDDEKEQERLDISMINWEDFVVVETIDFADIEDEDLPPMRIMKNANRPEDRLLDVRNTAKYVSPITGELLFANEMSQHVRFSLIDPKYKEQKERANAKSKVTGLAQDDEILGNMAKFACNRPDIFGTIEEEVFNAVNTNQPKQVICDRMNYDQQPYLMNQPSLSCMSVNAPTIMLPPPPPGSQFTSLSCPFKSEHGMPQEISPPKEAHPEEPSLKKQRLDDSTW